MLIIKLDLYLTLTMPEIWTWSVICIISVNHFKLCTEFLQILKHCQKCLHFGRRHMRCIEMFCKFCNRIHHVSRLWYFPHVHTKHWLIFPVCSCSKWCLDRMPNEHKSTLAYLLTVRSLNPCCLSAAVVFVWLTAEERIMCLTFLCGHSVTRQKEEKNIYLYFS